MVILNENKWMDIEMSLRVDAPIEDSVLRAALENLLPLRGKSDRAKELEDENESLRTNKIESLNRDIEWLEGKVEDYERFTETVSQDFKVLRNMTRNLVDMAKSQTPMDKLLDYAQRILMKAENCVEQHCEEY